MKNKNYGKMIINTKNSSIKIKGYPEYIDLVTGFVIILTKFPDDNPQKSLIKTMLSNVSKKLGTPYTIDEITKGAFSYMVDKDIDDFKKELADADNLDVLYNILDDLNDDMVKLNEKISIVRSKLEKVRQNEKR